MSRLSRLVLAVLLVSGTLGAARAQESFYKVKQPPPAGTGWTYVNVGFTFADNLTLDELGAQFQGDGPPGMVLGVGAYWRTSRIDLGVLFQGISSFYFEGVTKSFQTGAQFRAAANLRWRYIEDSWGALFMRLTPGLMVFNHSPRIREEAGFLRSLPIDNDASGIDEHSVGFALGFDFGLMFYITDSLAVTVDLDLVSGTSTIATPGGDVDFGLVRGLITASIEWRM